MTAAETLAAFTSALRWEAVAPGVREQIKAHLLDTLGVIYAGVRTSEAQSLQRLHARWAGNPEASASISVRP